MTPQRQRVARLSREERMRQILAAATDEFRSLGLEGASMSGIAKRAGIVEGSIYRFFNNKAELMTRVIEAWYEDMLETYVRELTGISGTRERLRFMVWRHLKTVHDEPEMCRLMFNHVRSNANYRTTEVYRLNNLYTAHTLEIVREGMAAGEIRADLDLRMVRDLIYGGVEHRAWKYLRGEGKLDPEKVADALVDTVLGGIRATDQTAEHLTAIESALLLRGKAGNMEEREI